MSVHAVASSLPRNQSSPKSMCDEGLRGSDREKPELNSESWQLNFVRADQGFKLSTEDSQKILILILVVLLLFFCVWNLFVCTLQKDCVNYFLPATCELVSRVELQSSLS